MNTMVIVIGLVYQKEVQKKILKENLTVVSLDILEQQKEKYNGIK